VLDGRDERRKGIPGVQITTAENYCMVTNLELETLTSLEETVILLYSSTQYTEIKAKNDSQKKII
jgi:hypothetical protein